MKYESKIQRNFSHNYPLDLDDSILKSIDFQHIPDYFGKSVASFRICLFINSDF